MLKIRDDIELNELEKFGFKNIDNPYAYCYMSRVIEENCARVCICKSTQFAEREIIFDYLPELDFDEFYDVFEIYQDILYDLIQSNLVEKVEDNNNGK